MKSTRGFTLIELLVVIAIIGILSSVVLASLTTARSRGTAAAVQNELSNMRAQAELYYSASNSYGPTTPAVGASEANCTSGQTGNVLGGTNGLGSLIQAVASKSDDMRCVASSTAWAVAASVGSGSYCVDSTGKSTSTSALVTVNGSTLCP